MKQTIFFWQGINHKGEKVYGETNGLSIIAIKALLCKQGIYPQVVRKKRRSLFKKTISDREITYFTRQMATMLKAGIPLIQAFTTLRKGITNIHLQTLLTAIQKDIETGTSLNKALSHHKNYFNAFYCNLIAVGEQSGELDILFEKLALHKEKIAFIKSKLHKALYYPIAVLVVSILVTVGLLLFVVPQFETLFKSFGATLPFLTRVIIKLSEFLQSYGLLLLIVTILVLTFLIYKIKHYKNFHEKWDGLVLKIPIIGIIIKKAVIARFTQTLAITFSAGVPLMDGLKSAAKITGNHIYHFGIEKVAEDVAQGEPLNTAMRTTQLFPEMVLQMVSIGEESGRLENVLTKIADLYQEEVKSAVDSLSTLIEPIIMIILSILVGGLIVAMYLPIFKLGSIV